MPNVADPPFVRTGNAAAIWTLAIATRIVVLAIGLAAVHSIGYTLAPGQFRVSRNEVENLPARFDAGWYLRVARRGYEWRPELHGHRHSLAFFPAYPMSMRVAGALVTVPARVAKNPELFGGGDARVLWGGVLVSILCFALALHNVYRLALLDVDAGAAWRSVVLLAAYPFALFFGVAYSESLFLLACSGTVLAWRRGNLPHAWLWGILAGLTRSNGWTISVALLADCLAARASPRRAWRWLAACAPLAGAAIYSGYAYALTGSALEWATAQEGWGRHVSIAGFFTRHWKAIADAGPLAYILRDPVDAATLAAACVALLAAISLARQKHWLYAVLVLAYVAPALALDLPAAGRMTAVLFPVFIWLAERWSGWRFAALTLVFAAGQAFLAARFFLWKTPY
jgi:mannosyltransferase PIG-V